MLQSACRAANWFSSSSAAVRTWWRVADRKARESAGVTVRSRFSKAALIVCRAGADTAGVSGIVSVFTHFVLSRSTESKRADERFHSLHKMPQTFEPLFYGREAYIWGYACSVVALSWEIRATVCVTWTDQYSFFGGSTWLLVIRYHKSCS